MTTNRKTHTIHTTNFDFIVSGKAKFQFDKGKVTFDLTKPIPTRVENKPTTTKPNTNPRRTTMKPTNPNPERVDEHPQKNTQSKADTINTHANMILSIEDPSQPLSLRALKRGATNGEIQLIAMGVGVGRATYGTDRTQGE